MDRARRHGHATARASRSTAAASPRACSPTSSAKRSTDTPATRSTAAATSGSAAPAEAERRSSSTTRWAGSRSARLGIARRRRGDERHRPAPWVGRRRRAGPPPPRPVHRRAGLHRRHPGDRAGPDGLPRRGLREARRCSRGPEQAPGRLPYGGVLVLEDGAVEVVEPSSQRLRAWRAVNVGPHLFWITSRAAGGAALLLSSASVALGLMMSSQAQARQQARPARHPRGALADRPGDGRPARRRPARRRFLNPGLAGIAIPFVGAYRPLWTGLGIIAGYGLAVLGLTYYFRDRIGAARWRRSTASPRSSGCWRSATRSAPAATPPSSGSFSSAARSSSPPPCCSACAGSRTADARAELQYRYGESNPGFGD